MLVQGHSGSKWGGECIKAMSTFMVDGHLFVGFIYNDICKYLQSIAWLGHDG